MTTNQATETHEFCECLMPLGSKTCHHCKKLVRPIHRAGEPAERQKPCEFCEGTGKVHASREMALDAGDAQLEGVAITCWFCKGDGFTIEASDTPATAEAETDDEVRRFQDGIRDYLIEQWKVPDDRIDGAGCDSGDPLDFTKAEIGQAIAFLSDQHDAELSKLREALRRLFALVESGYLVRDTSNDADFMAFAKQGIRITNACAAARAALQTGE